MTHNNHTALLVELLHLTMIVIMKSPWNEQLPSKQLNW